MSKPRMYGSVGRYTPNNFVDLAGYAACAGEIAEMEERGKI